MFTFQSQICSPGKLCVVKSIEDTVFAGYIYFLLMYRLIYVCLTLMMLIGFNNDIIIINNNNNNNNNNNSNNNTVLCKGFCLALTCN